MSAPRRVLLVEDNQADVVLVEEALQKTGMRLEMIHARDGVEAIRVLDSMSASELPELVLLDLNLPGTDGLGVLRHLKASARLVRIPTLVMTSSCADTDVVKAYDLASNAFHAKPMEAAAFFHMIQRICEYWFELCLLPRRESE